MIWLNGKRIEGPTAPFDLSDRGLLLADGVFDTSLVVTGKVAFGDRHLARLQAHSAALGIEPDRDLLREAYAQASALDGPHALRVTVTRGPGPRGLRPPAKTTPTILATAAALPHGPAMAPVRLRTVPIRRNETSPAARLKTLAYLDSVLAMEAAARAGADEALMLNTQGRVACAAAANVFAIIGEELTTPPVEEGAMEGVTRAVLLSIASEVGLTPVEHALSTEDLSSADAVFLSSSLRLIAPVAAIDDSELKSEEYAALDALTARLQSQITIECGADPRISSPDDPVNH